MAAGRVSTVLRMSALPDPVTLHLRRFRPAFTWRHYPVFVWLLTAQIAWSGTATLSALARVCPPRIQPWHLRRLLRSARWDWRGIFRALVRQLLDRLPAPKDGTLYLVVDSTMKRKRGWKMPLAKKGRLDSNRAIFWGFHLVVLLAQWDHFRVPVDFRIVRAKDSTGYVKENALFREMTDAFSLPRWCQRVVVVADAGYASKDNLRYVEKRGYFYVFALPRTWKLENGQSLRDLVTHLPVSLYKRISIPSNRRDRRRSYWVFLRRASLRHVGDVTLVLSRLRRNDGPKRTKILVTNLSGVSVRVVVGIYQRRWWVETFFREMKGAMGLGEHQVSSQEDRVERSLAVPFMAYVLLLLVRRRDLKAGWSAFALKQAFAWDLVRQEMAKARRSRIVPSVVLAHAA